MEKMTIHVQLLGRDATDRVTEIADEWHTDIDAAFRAAKRLAGTRRKIKRDGGNWRVTGKNGTAWVVK